MKSKIKRMIRRIIWWAEDDLGDNDMLIGTETNRTGNYFYNSDYREFRIYKADSGYVVEVYKYAKNKDANNTLHIIRSDQDMGAELGKILVLEELKA